MKAKTDPEMADLTEAASRYQRAFALLISKTRLNIRRLADDPRAAPLDSEGDPFRHREGFFEIGNWTSSFYTGMALIAWQSTKDDFFLQQTLRLAPAYREKATVRFLDMHHDAGFLYSLYSIALHKLTGDPEHRQVGLAAADALLQRFNPKGNFIRAWGRLGTPEYENMAIIDCLMNLPLLYWASIETGDPKYREAAIRHADSTLRCFVRPDDSVCHAYRFDLATGAPIGPDNACGFGVDSHWARGTTWAIYGFALSHRYTDNPAYRDAAVRLARKFISLLDDEVVPVWDFRLPAGKAKDRDASAAAVAACAFQELERIGAADGSVRSAKRALLNRICSDDYLNFDDAIRCALTSTKGSKSLYTSWGDYFLMEALARETGVCEPFW